MGNLKVVNLTFHVANIIMSHFIFSFWFPGKAVSSDTSNYMMLDFPGVVCSTSCFSKQHW